VSRAPVHQPPNEVEGLDFFPSPCWWKMGALTFPKHSVDGAHVPCFQCGKTALVPFLRGTARDASKWHHPTGKKPPGSGTLPIPSFP